MSTIDRRTNIYVKIGRTLFYSDAVQSWKTANKSKRKTCCIAGCKEDIYYCAMVCITNGKDKGKLGFIPVCYEHSMKEGEEFPIRKETGVVFMNETGDGMEVKKKRSNPKSKKTSKKDVFRYLEFL